MRLKQAKAEATTALTRTERKDGRGRGQKMVGGGCHALVGGGRGGGGTEGGEEGEGEHCERKVEKDDVEREKGDGGAGGVEKDDVEREKGEGEAGGQLPHFERERERERDLRERAEAIERLNVAEKEYELLKHECLRERGLQCTVVRENESGRELPGSSDDGGGMDINK
jgi:hypothetical protein